MSLTVATSSASLEQEQATSLLSSENETLSGVTWGRLAIFRASAQLKALSFALKAWRESLLCRWASTRSSGGSTRQL